MANKLRCGDWGYGIGLLHDIGKYSEKFQKRLKGGPITDHASAGAKELFHQKNYPGAYCVDSSTVSIHLPTYFFKLAYNTSIESAFPILSSFPDIKASVSK